MEILENLLYTKEHEWALIDGDIATVGITDYAQQELGDIVFVELPEVGSEFASMESFGVIEAVKTVADLFAPVSGKVVEVNSVLIDKPDLINSEPYGGGWIVKIEMSNNEELNQLLDTAGYKSLISN